MAHSRDVVVDEQTGLAYVSAASGDEVVVFDANKNEPVRRIKLPGFERVMSLEFNQETGELFATSLNAPKAAKIEVRNNDQVTIYDLPKDQVESASGIAVRSGKQEHLRCVAGLRQCGCGEYRI